VTFASKEVAEIEDVIFEAVPGVELLFGKNSLTQGSFKAAERLVGFSDNTDLNSNLADLVFDSKYSGSKLELGANAAYRELSQNSPREGIKAQGELVRRDTYTAGLNAEYALTEKSKVGLAGRYDHTRYLTNKNLYLDQTNYLLPANYYFAITEKIDLSTGVQYRKNEIKDSKAGSDDYYFNVGARGEFTAKLSGKFNVGYNIRNPENSSLDDETGFGANAGLAYAYSPKTNLTLDLSRDFAVTSTSAGTQVSSAMIGASTSLTSAWSVNANLGYYYTEYLQKGSPSNDYVLVSVGATYVYSENINFDAGYVLNNYSQNDSGSSDFAGNVIRLAANFRY